jgi:hypothetical protein
MRLKGIMTSNTAFSCTCHPKRKEAYPQSVTAPIKVSQDGSVDEKKSLKRGRIWKTSVKTKHVLGDTSGRIANAVSPTSPRVTLCNAPNLTVKPSLGATRTNEFD